MTKPLTKVWRCPTCDVGFKAGEAREGSAVGRRCPEGHFHSYYELRRHEQGLPIRVVRVVREPRAPKCVMVDRRGNSDAEMLAVLWIAAVDALIEQMPAGSLARKMIEGATAQAYRASKNFLDHKPQAEAA